MTNETLKSNDQQALLQSLLDVFGQDGVDLLDEDAVGATETENRPSRSLDEVLGAIDEELHRSSQSLATIAAGHKASANRSTGAKHILIQLDQSVLAVPISHVVEVKRVPSITSIPYVPEWLRGISNLRGEIISVVDGRLFFGLPANEHSPHRRLVILQSLKQDRCSGFIVDRVVGMSGIDASEIGQSSIQAKSTVKRFLIGSTTIGTETVGVLDLEMLLSCEEMSQFAA